MNEHRLQAIHHEHLEFDEEHHEWERDLKQWKFDHQLLEDRVQRLQHLLEDHSIALTAHGEAMREQDLHIARHEAAVGRQARGEHPDGSLGLDAEHRRMRLHQQQLRGQHERLGQLHRRLLHDAWRLLHGSNAPQPLPPAIEPSPLLESDPSVYAPGRQVSSAAAATLR